MYVFMYSLCTRRLVLGAHFIQSVIKRDSLFVLRRDRVFRLYAKIIFLTLHAAANPCRARARVCVCVMQRLGES